MKTLVTYKSKTGFTEKYARWIAEELSADLLSASKVKSGTLANYDTIIFGGSLHAVGINGVNLIKSNLAALKDRKIAVFAVGASPFREDLIKELRDRNFNRADQSRIRLFYMRGGFDYGKLGIIDKILMTLLKWKLQKKGGLTDDEKGMLSAYNKPADFTNKDNIKELIAYIKQ